MSDSDILLDHMRADGSPDGSFAQNLKYAAAVIGWMPDRLSDAMQALVAEGRVKATHEDGDPTRVAGSSWLIVADDDQVLGDGDPSSLGIKQLRALAKDRDVDIKGLKSKDEIIAALEAAEASEPTKTATGDDDQALEEKDVDQLIQFAGENEIELPEGDLSQEDLVAYISEALAEREAVA